MDNATEDSLLHLCNYPDRTHSKFDVLVRRYLNPMRDDPIVPLLTFSDPHANHLDDLFEEAEREKSPETTAHLLHAVLKAQVKSSFHKINVHAAMTPAEIKMFLLPVIEQANLLQTTYHQALQRKSRSNSTGGASSRKESLSTKHSILESTSSSEATIEDSRADSGSSRTPFVTVRDMKCRSFA